MIWGTQPSTHDFVYDEHGDPIRDWHYYENISKYSQFIGGYDDLNMDVDSVWLASDNLLEAASLREKMGKSQRMALKILGMITFNHVISALDAGWLHSRKNGVVYAIQVEPRILRNTVIPQIRLDISW